MEKIESAPDVDVVRAWLVELVAGYLECPPSDIVPGESLSEYGLDSVYSLTVCTDIEEKLGLSLEPTIIWDYPSIDALTGVLVKLLAARTDPGRDNPAAGQGRSLPSEALAAEARLPDDIRPDAEAIPASDAPYRHVLLTGATGFAGAFLLREILDRSEARVFALVRAPDTGAGLDRVRANLRSYGLWREADAQRLVIVPGDLGLPGFGLPDDAYADLAERIDVIFHNGAAVNFVLPYARLKSVNVLGTQEVLRLACRRRLKPVHFVSSMGVFPERAGVNHFAETELEVPDDVTGSYRQSKWVADRLVTLAGQRGLPVCVYRPGNITGTQTTGVCTTDSIINDLLKGCIQAESAMEFKIDMLLIPVDFCAAAVAHIGLSGRWHGTIFNMPGARSLRWSKFIDMVNGYGYPVRTVPYGEWYARMSAPEAANNALRSYMPLFQKNAPSADIGVSGNEPRVATGNLDAALAGTGIECRAVDESLMETYLDYFRSIGHLPPPPSHALAMSRDAEGSIVADVADL